MPHGGVRSSPGGRWEPSAGGVRPGTPATAGILEGVAGSAAGPRAAAEERPGAAPPGSMPASVRAQGTPAPARGRAGKVAKASRPSPRLHTWSLLTAVTTFRPFLGVFPAALAGRITGGGKPRPASNPMPKGSPVPVETAAPKPVLSWLTALIEFETITTRPGPVELSPRLSAKPAAVPCPAITGSTATQRKGASS